MGGFTYCGWKCRHRKSKRAFQRIEIGCKVGAYIRLCRAMTVPRTVSKCVILARGLGTRMRSGDSGSQLDSAQSAVASAGLKAMIPVGRPFLDYVLGGVADAGFRQVCLVIGPEHSVVRDYYGPANPPTRIQVTFAAQHEARGTADALLAAEVFAGFDEFAVLNGDNFYPITALQELQALGRPGAVLFEANTLVSESNIPKERIQAFAHCMVDPDGFLADIVEKPGATVTAANFDGGELVSMNCWRFGQDIFRFCREVPLSPRGEYELPIAVKAAIEHGTKLKTAISQGGVLDLSRRSDIAAVTERLRNVKVYL
jgi:dTDP-glucose pyrophosphorylase